MGANFSDFPYDDPGPAVTKDRVLRIAKKIEDPDAVIIESIKDQDGQELGEGLASNMEAIEVQALVGPYEDPKTYNWVLKSTPRDVSRFHRSRHVFSYNEREVRFFHDLLPRLKEFANSKKDGGFSMPSFTETPFVSWTAEDKILVMENLKLKGYKDGINLLVDGIDEDHTEMGVKWLAKFHALGYAYFQNTFCECRNWRCQSRGTCDCGIKNLEKSDLNIFLMNFSDIPNFDGIQNSYSTISEDIFLRTLDEIEKDGEKKYVEKFQDFLDKHGHFFRQCEQFREFDHTAFKVNTFTHGDAHVGNIMYQYGEENNGTNVRDVTFIDFQFVLYKPAILDLHKFIWTSTTPDTRKHLTKILKTYYTTFMKSIKQLKSPLKYTFDEFLNDFRRSFVDGLYWATHIFLSQVCTPKEDRVSMDELSRLCSDMVSNYNNPEFQEEYNKVIAKLDESSRKNDKYQTRMKGFMDDVMDLDLIYSGNIWL